MLTFKNSTWRSLCVECFVRISEQAATFALHVINWLVFITGVGSVYCAVRYDSLYKADYVSSLKGLVTAFRHFRDMPCASSNINYIPVKRVSLLITRNSPDVTRQRTFYTALFSQTKDHLLVARRQNSNTRTQIASLYVSPKPPNLLVHKDFILYTHLTWLCWTTVSNVTLFERSYTAWDQRPGYAMVGGTSRVSLTFDSTFIRSADHFWVQSSFLSNGYLGGGLHPRG